jgi:arabinose-5-phosphate isomerase
MTPQQQELLDIGRRSLRNDIEALKTLEASLDNHFSEAVEAILACRGKVILTGMGKSGHGARKIAATLTSTGTPAIFLHPAEASHGDMGIIGSEDIIVALSYSGDTDEIRNIVRFAEECDIPIIAITGRASSYLAHHADILLNVEVEQEDCMLNIVPTTSTTAQIAVGDALASALIYARNFRAEDFARLHPGGYIERRIATTITNK